MTIQRRGPAKVEHPNGLELVRTGESARDQLTSVDAYQANLDNDEELLLSLLARGPA